jgi:hypothetical protein
MKSTQLPPVWHIRAGLLVLLSIGIALVAPLVDHHAFERLPWHEHMVTGASPVEQAYFLETHTHAYERPHEHGAPNEPQAGQSPEVIVISGSTDIGLLAEGLWQSDLVTNLLWPIATLVAVIRLPVASLSAVPSPIPTPPPRSSLA